MKQIKVFSNIPLEDRIPAKPPPPKSPFKAIVNEIIRDMDVVLDAIYADSGRPSIVLKYFLRASILQILYSIWCEYFIQFL